MRSHLCRQSAQDNQSTSFYNDEFGRRRTDAWVDEGGRRLHSSSSEMDGEKEKSANETTTMNGKGYGRAREMIVGNEKLDNTALLR